MEWLQKYYRTLGNAAAELEVTRTLFQTQPFLRHYQELRDLAKATWSLGDTMDRGARFPGAGTEHSTLDPNRPGRRRHRPRLGTARKDSYGYSYYGYGNIALEVARAAEETRPREARELYRQHAERLIAQRGRQNYQEACKYLAKMRALYEKLGEGEAWTSYLTALREQNRNLRALKEELAAAGP